jgi:hypothetical protein
MSLAAASTDLTTAGRQRGRTYLEALRKSALDNTVAFWIFMGGLVMIEPSPYEYAFALVFPLSLFAGLKFYRTNVPLILLTVAFSPFALTGAFQATANPVTKTIVFEMVTIFLLLTCFFVANYVAEAPQERARRIMWAYTAIAVISAIVGTLAYLGLIPGGSSLFTLYGRAKAFFKDPNVFGPFLILPAVYALQRLLFASTRRQVAINGGIILILLIGVFVSFSRAAWGNLLGSSVLLFVLCFALEANARDKVRMILLAMVGIICVLVALGGLLSIPAVGRLFTERASVEQNYDSGENGRFGRQGFAFELALSHPLGIGPGEFRTLRNTEEPHDTYANVIHVYGWGGALCYYGLIILTLIRGFGALIKRSPNRRLLIPLLSVYVPLIIEAGIIDIDHWRHYFLIVGMIWGVTTGYLNLKPGETRVTAMV